MIFITLRRTQLLLLILSFVLSSPCFAQEKYLPYPGIIHIHSSISPQAIYGIRKLASLAQDKGIKILIFSDTFLARWEYGLPIFSHIFKASFQERSVIRYGLKQYFENFEQIKDEFPEMLLLEGVEVAPFYWWSGSPLKKNLTLNDRSKHLLVTGLKQGDYTYLPVVGNRYLLPHLKDIPVLLIPLLSIILGMFFLKKSRQKKFLGFALSIIGILCLFNFFPFSSSRYNPYRGNKQFSPYQDLINYVNKKGGLVFWAHPELTELISAGKFITVYFYTPSYPGALMLTSGYTGFGVNLTSTVSLELILAGGEWDKVLMSYCQGRRTQPAWVVGETDYRGKGPIDAIQNIFFLTDFKPESVYEALRKGRFYISYYSTVSLRDFHIEDSQGKDVAALMGEELEVRAKPRLHIKGNFITNTPEDLRIEIIREGKIIQRFNLSNEQEFDLEFQDDSWQGLDKKSYYRLNFFAGGNLILMTNPIFVKTKNG